jgi:hypothetical protein
LKPENPENELQAHDRAWQESLEDSKIADIIGKTLTERLDQYCHQQSMSRREALCQLVTDALEK